MEPVGPLPPSVYRRRRAVALGAVVLLFALVTWGIATAVGGTGQPEDAAARAAAGAPGTETPRPAAFAAADQAERARQAGERGAAAGDDTARPGPATTTDAPAGGATRSSGRPTPAAPRGEAATALPAPPGVIGRGLLPGAVLGPLPSSSAPSSVSAPSTPPSAPPAPSAAPSSAPEAAPRTGDATAADEREGRAPRCADGEVSVLARTDKPRYAPGEKPVLSLVVRNTGPAACVRDLDAARQAVAVVRKPGDGLWSSNDCAPGDTDDVRVLGPGQEAVFSVRWSGRTSQPGCPETRETVPAGRYQLLARLDDTISEPVAFTLES